MNDAELRLTPTHAAEEFPGTVLGIHTSQFAWVGLALVAALAVFTGLFYGQGRDFFVAAQWAALPVLAVVAYLRLCQQLPPNHLLDLLDSLFTGGHARPPQQFPPHPLHDL